MQLGGDFKLFHKTHERVYFYWETKIKCSDVFCHEEAHENQEIKFFWPQQDFCTHILIASLNLLMKYIK